MSGVTDILSTMVGRPVIDRTGFAGRFNIHVEWTQEAHSGTRVFFKTLEERLGLQFTSDHGPVEFLILDQVEELHAK